MLLQHIQHARHGLTVKIRYTSCSEYDLWWGWGCHYYCIKARSWCLNLVGLRVGTV